MGAGDDHGGSSDYYDVLGVPETASAEDIIRAYRRLARQHHPDHNPGGGAKRFQQITDAYDVIGDVDRRRQYDAQRRSEARAGIRIPVNRVPDGGPPRAGEAAAGAEGERPVVRLSFREAVLGTIAAVGVQEERPCAVCGGSGLEQPDASGCPDCGGTGSGTRRTGQIPVRHVCARCAGRGRTAPRACTACDASGHVPGTRTVKVRVPAGVTDGARLRLRRQEPHPPLEAVVRVGADPLFGREGDDVTVHVPVAPAEAALGADVDVPTVDGPPVRVRIPAGTQPGRRLRVAGRGVRRRASTGDLIVTVDVVIPTELSEAERAAYEALAAASGLARPSAGGAG